MQDRQPGFAGGIESLGRNGPQFARGRPPSVFGVDVKQQIDRRTRLRLPKSAQVTLGA